MLKSSPRKRKHKRWQKGNQDGCSNLDTNVVELRPLSKEESEKNQRLQADLREEHPKISRQKKNRLDKYIENKLKKDENLALLKKLSLAKIDTTQLQSSRHLGKSPKRCFKKALPSPFVVSLGNGILHNSMSSDDDSEGSVKPSGAKEHKVPVVSAIEPSTIGSGLKRPLEVGPDGLPIIKKRKQIRKAMPAEIAREEFGSEEDESSENEVQRHVPSSGGSFEERGLVDDSESPLGEDGGNRQASGDDDDSTTKPSTQPQRYTFKTWAVQQIHEAMGFNQAERVPSNTPTTQHMNTAKSSSFEADEPLPLELQTTNGDPNRKVFTVQVDRPSDVQAFRLRLPVVGEEQKIMEAIHNNPSVVICGATGSGKTTQLPQFLFEAGYGNPESPNPGIIGITQPRRVAAVSMAKRVGDELGQFSGHVSYQIRFDSSVSSKTAIKFMTDGVLIREIAQDFSLSKYSVIIIDEAHERTVNTDMLIGMVSRIVDLRKNMATEDPNIKPLKLVIMSATLRISDFIQNKNLFRQGPPPLVQAEGRQYPVTIHFARRTHRDYVEESFRKVSKGHRKLPPGGFLVFLTGQNEIQNLAKRLKQTFKSTLGLDTVHGRVQISAAEAPLEVGDIELGGGVAATSSDEDISDVEFTGLDENQENDEFDCEEGTEDSRTRVHILPLYSQLPTKEQLKVFEAPPEGSRLIVLATNVAETSLTIPGIRYVFDCGRSKERQYDISTGVQRFQIGWISKAGAIQRAGRAGRTGAGHCYRLYSSAVYERDFPEDTEPEILRTPIEEVVLQIKSMGLRNVVNFPFPTPPNRLSLVKAEKLLKNLGALSLDGQVTDIGRRLALYPLSPRFGKMLQIGHQHGCMPYVIAMVSALAAGELFIQESQIEMVPLPRDDGDPNDDRLIDTCREMRRKEYERTCRVFSKYDDKADALKLLAAVCAYGYASDGNAFCNQMFLRPNVLKETLQLRRQLNDIIRCNNPGLIGAFQARLAEPSDKQIRALKQITAAGFIDQVAIRADLAPVPPDTRLKPKRAIDVPYITLLSSHERKVRESTGRVIYIHPSSVLCQLSPSELPQYLIYSHLQQCVASHISDKPSKIRMFPLTAISGLQLSALAHGTPLIQYGKPIGKIESLGGSPERRECWVIPSLIGEPGSVGWPLPAKKAIQKKDEKEGWIIERFVK